MFSLHRSGWQYDKCRFILVTFAAAAAVSLQYNNVLTYVECVLHCQLLGHNSESFFTLSKYEVLYKVLRKWLTLMFVLQLLYAIF
jgi:hypothetical protein